MSTSNPSRDPSSTSLESLASSVSSVYSVTTSELEGRRGRDPSGIVASEFRQTTDAVAENSILISDAGSSVTFDQLNENSAANEQDLDPQLQDANTPALTAASIVPPDRPQPNRGPLGQSLRSLIQRTSQRSSQQQPQDYAFLRAIVTSNYDFCNESNQQSSSLEIPDGSAGSGDTLHTRAIIREPQEPYYPLPSSRPNVVNVDSSKKGPPPPPELSVSENANEAPVLCDESDEDDQKQQRKKTPPSRKENKKSIVKPPREGDVLTLPEEGNGTQQEENAPPPNPMVFPANATASGKALEFAQSVIQMHQRWTESPQGINTSGLLTLCPADDLVFFAEQMLLHREQVQQRQQSGPSATVKTSVEMVYAFAPRAALQHPAQQQQQHHEVERLRAASLYTISSRKAVFGQGIYTSKSVYAGQRHQWKSMPRIFLVARFLGKVVHVGTSSVSNNILRGSPDVDAVVGMLGTEEVAVLRRSSQCLPLLKIEPDFLLVSHAQGNIVLSQYQNQLSKALNELFSGGEGAAAKPIVPNEATPSPPPLLPAPAVAAAPPQLKAAPNPAPLASVAAVPTLARVAELTPEISVQKFPRMVTILLYTAPTSQRQRQAANLPTALVIDANVNLKTMTPLHPRYGPPAMCPARCGVPPSSVVKIIPSKPPEPGSTEMPPFSMAYSCGSTFNVGIDVRLHAFATWPSLLDDHALLQRIQQRVVEHSRRCTAGCRRHQDTQCDFDTPVGTMPSASMRIDELPDLTCPGFTDETNDNGGDGSSGSFLITYRICGGTQCDYHPTPGQSFPPVYREAFLPANWQGRALLKRLQYAFVRGWTFRVGESVTTGMQGVITWASIPHKTTLFHHLYGYPDPDFFVDANNALDALGVPVAGDL